MRKVHIVSFFHRGSWHIFEEYGPTMEDVAQLRAKQLSVPFGHAEMRTLLTPNEWSGDIGETSPLTIALYKDGDLEHLSTLIQGVAGEETGEAC